MNSNAGYAALSRTPTLKSLSLDELGIDMPFHVRPLLRLFSTMGYVPI
jgi:hypothetical protein